METEEQHLIKTIDDVDYTEAAKDSYNYLCHRFSPFNRKVTNILEMLKSYFQVDEWQALNERDSMNGMYDSTITDRMIDFMNHRPVDFTKLVNLTMETYTFVGREKRAFVLGKIDEVMWGIFLSIVDPKTYNN
jgi:hypothetical protein